MKKLGFLLATLAFAATAHAQTEAAPPPEPPPPPPKKGLPITNIVYDGGTILRSDDGTFELKINGLLQARYEWANTSKPTAADADARSNDSRFVLPRARMGLSGFVWKNTGFKVEFSFSDAGNTRLRDFYLNQSFADGKVQLRAGQWKKPFNRNEIVSDFATEFLEKAVTNIFGSRDIGIGIGNGHDKSPEGLEWVFALFNGQGDGSTATCTIPTGGTSCTVGAPGNTPGDFQPQLEARVGFNHGGIKGYSEADLEGGPLRFAAAVSYRGSNLQDHDAAPLRHDLDLDAVVKVAGLDLWAAVFIIKARDVDTQLAFHVQAGYMIVPKTMQIAARFAMVPLNVAKNPAEGADQEYTQEIRGAFTWFFSKSHNFKWATDAGITKDTTDGAKAAFLFRTGAQLIF